MLLGWWFWFEKERRPPFFCGFYDGDKMLGRSKGGGRTEYLFMVFYGERRGGQGLVLLVW